MRAVNKHKYKICAGIKKTCSETRPGFPFGTVNRGAADRILDNPPLKPARGGRCEPGGNVKYPFVFWRDVVVVTSSGSSRFHQTSSSGGRWSCGALCGWVNHDGAEMEWRLVRTRGRGKSTLLDALPLEIQC